jgi:hypothetical protein
MPARYSRLHHWLSTPHRCPPSPGRASEPLTAVGEHGSRIVRSGTSPKRRIFAVAWKRLRVTIFPERVFRSCLVNRDATRIGSPKLSKSGEGESIGCILAAKMDAGEVSGYLPNRATTLQQIRTRRTATAATPGPVYGKGGFPPSSESAFRDSWAWAKRERRNPSPSACQKNMRLGESLCDRRCYR